MRRINVVKAFNFCHPDGRIQPFGVGSHEVGTYKKPVWDRTLDKPVEGQFEELEIAEHSYVKLHTGKPLTSAELLAESAKLKEQAEALARQAISAPDETDDEEPEVEALKLDTGNRVAPNTRSKGNADAQPNARA